MFLLLLNNRLLLDDGKLTIESEVFVIVLEANVKISRKIRRTMLRLMPQWMKCFARSVARVQSSKAIKGIKQAAGRFGKTCKGLCYGLKGKISRLGDDVSAHSREWAAVALVAGLVAVPCVAVAAPAGGEVVGGQATIQQQAEITNITQTSQRAAINWSSFDIAKTETVNFIQPFADAATLNRVTGAVSSQIFGNINANGHVYIVNPYGINIGDSAKINVNGLGLSTSDISPAAFMSNGMSYGSGSGSIVVAGNVKAGSITVIAGARDIRVNGAIDTNAETSGNGGTITIVADNSDGVLEVSGATLSAAAAGRDGNGGTIKISAAKVYGLDSMSINAGGGTNGKNGSLLIDSSSFHIVSAAAPRTDTAIGNIALGNLLNTGGADVCISALSSAAAAGDIFVENGADIVWAANNSLTLSAFRNINISANITGSAEKAGVTLIADNSGTNTGTVTFNGGSKISLHPGANSGYAKIYYNPAQDFLHPTDYSANFSGASGHLVAYMLVNQLGCADDGVTEKSLAAISNNSSLWDKNYALSKDIDASATTAWNSGAGFRPIGDGYPFFTGKFDGQNHTISNLYINRSGLYVGLFGYLDGGQVTINNLTLQTPSITGSEEVGGFVGEIYGGLISNCVLNGGTVSGFGWSVRVGGIEGYSYGGRIDGSVVNDATISGSSATGYAGVGGIAGGVYGGSITGFVNGGLVSGESRYGTYVGGITSDIDQAIITGSSVSGVTVTGTAASGYVYAGGIAGWNRYNVWGGATIFNSVASDVTISGNQSGGDVYVGGIAGLNENVVNGCIVNRAILDGHSGTGEEWSTDVGGIAGYNSGTITGSTVNDGTITGNGYDGYVSVGGIAGVNYGTIIGGSTNDGEIKASNTKKYVDYFGGLDTYAGGVAGENYGAITGSTTERIIVTGSSSEAEAEVGGIAGWNEGTISNCAVSETIGRNLYGDVEVGGIAGGNLYGTIVDCEVINGIFRASNGAAGIGGIAGFNAGTIATVRVSGARLECNDAREIYGVAADVGGIAGYNDGLVTDSEVSEITIAGNSLSGDIHFGGIAGWNFNGTITDTVLNTAAIVGNSLNGAAYIGGIAGINEAWGTINSDTVNNAMLNGSSTDGNARVGGIAGKNSKEDYSSFGGRSWEGSIADVVVSNATITGASSSGNACIGRVVADNDGAYSGNDTRGRTTDGSIALDNGGGKITVLLSGMAANITQTGDPGLELAASTVNGGLTINAAGAVSQSGALRIDRLTINAGSSDIILEDTGNSIGSLSLDGGCARIIDNMPGMLTLSNSTLAGINLTCSGAVQVSGSNVFADGFGTNGNVILTNQGDIWIAADGQITVNDGAALYLAANGGNIKNNSAHGGNAIVMNGNLPGRYILWSDNPNGFVSGGLNQQTADQLGTYAGYPPASPYWENRAGNYVMFASNGQRAEIVQEAVVADSTEYPAATEPDMVNSVIVSAVQPVAPMPSVPVNYNVLPAETLLGSGMVNPVQPLGTDTASMIISPCESAVVQLQAPAAQATEQTERDKGTEVESE